MRTTIPIEARHVRLALPALCRGHCFASVGELRENTAVASVEERVVRDHGLAAEDEACDALPRRR